MFQISHFNGKNKLTGNPLENLLKQSSYIDKMIYLKGLVKDEAADTINGLQLPNGNTPFAQFFPPLLWLSEMVNRNPNGGVKIETKTFFRYFLEDIYYT